MENPIADKLDRYNSGRMTAEEQVQFERELSADPELMRESDFQKTIIEGIQQARKLELKSRLSAIPVSSSAPIMEFLSIGNVFKGVVAISIISAITLGYPYFVGEDLLDEDQKALFVDRPSDLSFDFEWIALAEANTASVDDVNDLTLDVSKVEEHSSEVATIDADQEEPVIVKSSSKPFTPQVKTPDLTEISNEELVNENALDKLPEESVLKTSTSPVEVEAKQSRDLQIKYKYYDGKLFLQGDFDKAPYEILEINGSSSRRIFVYYLDSFYKVTTTDKLVVLPRVDTEDLINDLKLLRENK